MFDELLPNGDRRLERFHGLRRFEFRWQNEPEPDPTKGEVESAEKGEVKDAQKGEVSEPEKGEVKGEVTSPRSKGLSKGHPKKPRSNLIDFPDQRLRGNG